MKGDQQVGIRCASRVPIYCFCECEGYCTEERLKWHCHHSFLARSFFLPPELFRPCRVTNILEDEGGKNAKLPLMNLRDGCVEHLWFISSVITKALFNFMGTANKKVQKKEYVTKLEGLKRRLLPAEWTETRTDSLWQIWSHLHLSMIINSANLSRGLLRVTGTTSTVGSRTVN